MGQDVPIELPLPWGTIIFNRKSELEWKVGIDRVATDGFITWRYRKSNAQVGRSWGQDDAFGDLPHVRRTDTSAA